jgi:hypothetical protein
LNCSIPLQSREVTRPAVGDDNDDRIEFTMLDADRHVLGRYGLYRLGADHLGSNDATRAGKSADGGVPLGNIA